MFEPQTHFAKIEILRAIFLRMQFPEDANARLVPRSFGLIAKRRNSNVDETFSSRLFPGEKKITAVRKYDRTCAGVRPPWI